MVVTCFLSWAGERGTVPGQWGAAGGLAGRPGLVTMGSQGRGPRWGPGCCALVVVAPVGARGRGSPQGGVVPSLMVNTLAGPGVPVGQEGA